MNTFGTILIIYGILCLIIGLLKPPFIWNMKKLKIMAKMFGSSKNLQLFILVWGITAIVIGVVLVN